MKQILLFVLLFLLFSASEAQVGTMQRLQVRPASPLPESVTRRCGCAGDIEFINSTEDTLDLFMSYLTPASVPAIEGAMLPPVRNQKLLPDMIIFPRQVTAFRGSCKGGIQYEAIPRNNPSAEVVPGMEGWVRMSCMNRSILLSR